jgi:Short C-terminal domain
MATEPSAAPSAAAPRADAGTARALEHLNSLLVPGERLEAYAVQRRLFALTHRRVVVAGTTARFIALSRGLFGGFTPDDIRWQDLSDAQVRVGILSATLVISAYAGSEGDELASAARPTRTMTFVGLRKDEAQAVYRLCQAQEQAWREKRRVRELEEMRAKSGGVQIGAGFGGAPPPAPGAEGGTPGARLERAREMLAKGLITDAEYEQIKAKIVADL